MAGETDCNLNMGLQIIGLGFEWHILIGILCLMALSDRN